VLITGILEVSVIPEPGTALLLALGLVGFGLTSRRKRGGLDSGTHTLRGADTRPLPGRTPLRRK